MPVELVAPRRTEVTPTVVGVPERLPVTVLKVRPAGRGAAEKLVGVPEAVMVKLNGVPVVPPAVSGLLVMIGATPAAVTVIVSAALPVPVELVAPRRTEVTPTVVGVPERLPEAELISRPGGRGAAE